MQNRDAMDPKLLISGRYRTASGTLQHVYVENILSLSPDPIEFNIYLKHNNNNGKPSE